MEEREIYLFYGSPGKTCMAAFSSIAKASDWIREHKLTGLVVRHLLDRPSFDEAIREGRLPKYLDPGCAHARQSYVDDAYHRYFYYGRGEEDVGFPDADQRWVGENARHS